ncbi:unnamed protein product [Caenorhabditis nigoni]
MFVLMSCREKRYVIVTEEYDIILHEQMRCCGQQYFAVEDSGFAVEDSGFAVEDSDFAVEDSRFTVEDSDVSCTTACLCSNQGSWCTYAHSTAELRSNEARKISTQKLRKTKLCLNFASGGSGRCEYGQNCHFIHPEDGLLYERVYRKTLDFAKEKSDHKNDIQFLHAKKSKPGCTDFVKIEKEINEKIREWNRKHPKAQDYYDLHWMTTRGAVKYVKDILEKMKEGNKKKSWIETGRGRHSWNGIAAIKMALLQKYAESEEVSLVPDSQNDGLLILKIL